MVALIIQQRPSGWSGKMAEESAPPMSGCELSGRLKPERLAGRSYCEKCWSPVTRQFEEARAKEDGKIENASP